MAKVEQAKTLPVRPDAVITLTPEEAAGLRQYFGDLMRRDIESVIERENEESWGEIDTEAIYRLTETLFSQLDDLGY